MVHPLLSPEATIMLSSIRRAVNQFKVQGAPQLGTQEELTELCRQSGLRWRERLLTPLVTLRLFFLQILHGNVAGTALPHIAGFSFANSAYCAARQRLPLELLQRLLNHVTQKWLQTSALATADRWRGHRVFLADATGFTLPDTPALQKHFGQVPNQKPGCGFPVAFGLVLMHWGSGLVRRLVVAPLKTNELTMLPKAHDELQPGDLIVGDSTFGKYVELALLAQRGVYGLFRLSGRLVDFTPRRPHALPGQSGRPRSRWCRQLGTFDQIVEWFRPDTRSTWLAPQDWFALPKTLTVREVRYRVERPGFRVCEVTLVTTLLDSRRYPLEALAEMFRQRWTIETNLRHLKTTLGMDTLHSQTVEGVHKELLMFCLLYNLVRLVIGVAAKAQHVPIDRISFIDALRWLLYESPDSAFLDLLTQPRRPDRLEPRVIKQRGKRYPFLTKPRSVLRIALLSKPLHTK
jgi:hypothetical protein